MLKLAHLCYNQSSTVDAFRASLGVEGSSFSAVAQYFTRDTKTAKLTCAV